MSVPRGTRDARLSVRVHTSLKSDVRKTVKALDARGLSTSESELVEFLVSDGVLESPDQLDTRLRAWRQGHLGGRT